MNRTKLNSYNLKCGIDTIEITTDMKLVNKVEGITTKTPLQACSKHGFLYKYKVNPDKIIPNSGYCLTDFKEVLQMLREYLDDAETLYISRIDYRLDDFSNDYNRFYKINRLLLMLIANYHSAKNTYDSRDLLTMQKLTVRFDHDITDLHISGEYYNKELQEPDGDVKTRLELRERQVCYPLGEADADAFLGNWLERIDSAITAENFNDLINNINAGFKDLWRLEKSKFGNTTEFIAAYSDNIFTTRQLTQVYSNLGSRSARQQAYEYKHPKSKGNSRELQCFSLKDLEIFREHIAQAMLDFCKS